MHISASTLSVGSVVLACTILPLLAMERTGEHRPDQTKPGPWDNDVLVYSVESGGDAEKLTTFERAGVATVARMKDGRLIAAHQHFPEKDDANFDKVAIRFSSDEGKAWTKPQVIRLRGLPEGMRFPFDPTLVPLPDGRVRLYFTSLRGRRFEEDVPAIYSAISSNGVHYVFEPGVRFAVEDRIVIDCSVTLHDGVFHLIVPDNGTARSFTPAPRRRRPPPGGNGYHATSKYGLKFERAADVKLSSKRARWLGAMQSDEGKLLFFGSGSGPWPVTSTNGVIWKPTRTSVRAPGADPGAVRLLNGSWLLVVTGPPRAGTPSAKRHFRRIRQRPAEHDTPADADRPRR